MKRNLLYTIILLIPFLFVSFSFAVTSMPKKQQVNLTKIKPLMDARQVKDLIETKTKTVGQDKVVVLDNIYTDYGSELGTIIIETADYFTLKTKSGIFNNYDHAFFIKLYGKNKVT